MRRCPWQPGSRRRPDQRRQRASPAVALAAMAGLATPASGSLDLLHGVEMTVTVEHGRTKMLLRDLLALQTGSVIELDRAAGSPVDVLINDNLLARGVESWCSTTSSACASSTSS